MHEVWKRQQVHEDARKMHRAEVLDRNFGKKGKATCGRPRFGEKSGQAGRSSDLVQKCSGHARPEHGMNCCKPELVGTKEHGKILKRIQILEDGRVLAKEATN